MIELQNEKIVTFAVSYDYRHIYFIFIIYVLATVYLTLLT